MLLALYARNVCERYKILHKDTIGNDYWRRRERRLWRGEEEEPIIDLRCIVVILY